MNPVSPAVSTNQVTSPTPAPQPSSSPALDESQFDYIHETISAPSKFVHDAEGKSIPNSTFLLFQQQEKLLTSWLLSTINGEFLSSFTGTATAHNVWSKACSLFGATSSAKISQTRVDASSYPVSAEEHTNIVLMGISQDFDSVVTVASFSLEPLALDQLIEILLECEMWQQ